MVTAGGQGIRFRPFSAAVPKEMLPLGATPAIEHVVRECLSAGADDVIVITRPEDRVVPAHMRLMREQGHPVRTVAEDPRHGYGNAAGLLTLAQELASCPEFAVAFGDDILLDEPRPGDNLTAMRRELHRGAAAVIAAHPVPRAMSATVGVIDTDPTDLTRVSRLRQRPHPDTLAPSPGDPLAVVSRLMLRPGILERLVPTELARGEVDLGVAVGLLAAEHLVRLHRINGRWVTVGDPASYLRALLTYRFLTEPAPYAPEAS